MSLVEIIACALRSDSVVYSSDPASDARVVLAAIEAAGWQVVPKEPTEEMLTNGDNGFALVIWRDALAAAPKPE
jgi:hypothetical protein